MDVKHPKAKIMDGNKDQSATPRSGWRLGAQITFLVAGSLLITLLATAIGSSLMINRALNQDYMRGGKNIAAVLAEQASVYVLLGSPTGAAKVIDVVRLFPGVEQVAIYEFDGRILSQYGAAADWENFNSEMFLAIERAELEQETDDYWQFVAPVFSDSAEPELEDPEANRENKSLIGLVRMRIGKAQLYEARNTIIAGNFTVIAFFSIILIFALRRLSAFLTRPLEEFVDTMRAGAEGHKRSLRVNLSGSRETVQLSNSFNHMMRVLEERELELANARDQALNAARLKSEFAANVSHEIRTPLNGIVGTLNLLRTSGLDRKQAGYVALAESASKALVELINDILDFSRLNLDQVTLARTAFDLYALLEELITLQASSVDAERLDLLLYYDPALPKILQSDPNKIRQLLNNFLNNAIKFTDAGTVELRVLREVDSRGKLWVKLSVIDSGIGIDDNDQAKIFLPYAQSDGSMARKYRGTGLGLAISEKLAELLHGDIGVNSVHGEGSEFFVRIPFHYSDAPRTAQDLLLRWPGVKIFHAADLAGINRMFANVCEVAGLPAQPLQNIAALREHLASQDTVNADNIVLLYGRSNAAASVSTSAGESDQQRVQYEMQQLLVDFSNLFIIFVGAQAALTQPEAGQAKSGDEPQAMHWQHARLSVVVPPFRYTQLVAELDAFFRPECDQHRNLPEPGYASTALQGRRILLVEDNEINQAITISMLRELGSSTTLAENGHRALELCALQVFDLVLMDCQLPGMNGFDATRAIRALPGEQASVPIIAMTANFEQHDQRQCYEAGMNDFLSKPMTLAELVGVAQKWLPDRAPGSGQGE